jgi:predicted alpha/beta-hydrolase family hydrolase
MFQNRPENKRRVISDITLILAHGAGAPADSGFMEKLSEALAREGVRTLRFEFPYMEKTRMEGRKRPPDRQPVLLFHFRQVIARVAAERHGRVVIGGKSMGGRMASLLAAEPDLAGHLAGCVCFGYPFHPPGRPEKWRVDHFDRFHCPVLIVQGSRDPFGRQEEVESRQDVAESGCRIYFLEGGEHDFRPLARQPETQSQLIETAARATADFIADLPAR